MTDLLADSLTGLVAGVITPIVLLWALRGRLIDWFADKKQVRKDINGIGGRVKRVEEQNAALIERIEENHRRLDRLRSQQQQQWETVQLAILEPMKALTTDLREVRDAQIRQQRTLEHMEEWVRDQKVAS